MSRLPRSIKKDRNYYDANEAKSFLLYYGPVTLKPFLPEPFYSHFLLLVQSMQIMQSESISRTELATADIDMRMFNILMSIYGENACRANVHIQTTLWSAYKMWMKQNPYQLKIEGCNSEMGVLIARLP